MDEQEYFSLCAILLQSVNTVPVIVKVLEGFSRFNIKDIDQHRDMLEYRGPLGGKIAVHEGILATAVPEVEDQVAEEADVILLYVDGRTEPCSERCGII